jgi:L-serine dehydratase
MVKQPASIFNDVIGPVMRGPSSSHVAAAARMGKLIRQMVKGNLKEVIVDFEPKGSLATTYHGHGSDMGLVGGLLNLEPSDPRLTSSLDEAIKQGIKISFNIVDYPAVHPNTYRMKVISNQNEEVHVTAISVGGGMIEVQIIEDLPVSISGDFYETLIFLNDVNELELSVYGKNIENQIADIDYSDYSIKNKFGVINLKTGYEISKKIISEFENIEKVINVIQLAPVLPIKSRRDCIVPFITAKEMLNVGQTENLDLAELALLYESKRGNISKEEVFDKMKEIVLLLKNSIEEGLKGTQYENRILGPQAWMIEKKQNEGKLIPGNVVNSIISSVTSMMEVKSSMGVIVAAPTAGACGGLPGTIIGTAKEMGLSIDDETRAMLAAGMIGVFIAEHATFAAEVGGCQVECGAGSGMAAGGLVQLASGTLIQGVDASSMALQNILGMVCDPVADRVEVPCLGKNVMAGVNALACANMALAGFDKVIPLDETIDAMFAVGKMLPSELRCTGCGGLSVTKTSQTIYDKINI